MRWRRRAPIGYKTSQVSMWRGVAAVSLGVIGSAACDRASIVTLQIGEPLRRDAGVDGAPVRCRENVDTSGEQLLEEFYRGDRERCVVLSVVADRGDVATRFHALRTQRITPATPGVAPCLGPRGASILEGLPDTKYTLRLMVLDLDGLATAMAVPLASQDLTRDLAGEWPDSVCLPWFSCTQLEFSRAAVNEALAECERATTPRVAQCSLGPSGGTTCPTPQP
jgi:hypothetical protein